jgi:3-deoxy-7-phosphoheptulonate synthase
METTGNAHTHLVLRGGASGPNYSSQHVRGAAELLRSHGLAEKVMIDCSHANSGKDPMRQIVVASEIAAQVADGERAICGVMIESNLLAGAQDLKAQPLVYGRSVTDACLGWEDTVPLLEELAEAVRSRRT